MRTRKITFRMPEEIWQRLTALRNPEDNISRHLNGMIRRQIEFEERKRSGAFRPTIQRQPHQQPAQPETFQDETISYDPEFNQA